jgi:hypothetical protein
VPVWIVEIWLFLYRGYRREVGPRHVPALSIHKRFKIKNPSYSPMEGRHELFEGRRWLATRQKGSRTVLVLA